MTEEEKAAECKKMEKYERHNEDQIRRLHPGDLVEIKNINGTYAHWGVYVGRGDIIHLTGQGLEIGMLVSRNVKSDPESANAWVTRGDLRQVARGKKIKVNNDSDENWEPLPVEEILKRATSKIGPADYNLFRHNCEHFVNWCRYDKSKSKQVKTFLQRAAAATGGLVSVLGVGIGASIVVSQAQKQ